MRQVKNMLLLNSPTREEIEHLRRITRPYANNRTVTQWYVPTGFMPVSLREDFQVATNIVHHAKYTTFLCNGEPAILYPIVSGKLLPLEPPPHPVKYLFYYYGPMKPDPTWAENIYVYHSEDIDWSLSPMEALFYRPIVLPPLQERRAFAVWFGPNDNERIEISDPIFCALTSFNKHNPDYQLLLVTNQEFASVPDFVQVVRVSKKECPFQQGYLAHFADYVRTKILYQYGGFYFDCNDTLTIKPIDPLYDTNIDKLQWVCCFAKENGFFSGVMICRTPGNSVLKKVLMSFHRDYRPNDYGYNMETATRSTILDHPDQIKLERMLLCPFYCTAVPFTPPETLDPRVIQIHLFKEGAVANLPRKYWHFV